MIAYGITPVDLHENEAVLGPFGLKIYSVAQSRLLMASIQTGQRKYKEHGIE